jgi:DNA-binding CsgD family transcriptional regulator
MGFVGRELELGKLEEALRSAARGCPATMVLGGDAGVGKSRLLGEFCDRARGQGALVLTGTCLELGGGGLPFGPVTEALRGLHGEVGGVGPGRLSSDARAELGRLLPSRHPGDERSRQVSYGDLTPTSQSRLFEALLALLGGLAARSPVVVVLEDVHWADASTRDLLLFLAHNLRAVGVVLVASFRTDELPRRHPMRRLLPQLLREDAVHYLELLPLGRDEFSLLLQDLTGAPPGPELTGALYERTQGNPFFATQLVAAGGDVSLLPERLREVLLLSLDGLSEATLWTLRVVAAAGGEHVDHELVTRVAGLPDEELDAALREAVQAGVLTSDPGAWGTYALRHALLTEAVLTTLLPGQANRLHRRLAQAIGHDPRLAVRSAAAELAHHWHLAREPALALVASLDAAREAESTVGIDEARSQVERALELWDQVPDARDRTGLERSEALEWAAWLSHLAGRARRALALQRAALSDLAADADLGRRARRYERLGQYLWEMGDGNGATRARAEAVRLLPADPPSAERARVLASYSQILMLTNRKDESEEAGSKALSMARALGERKVEAAVLATLGPSLAARGRDEGFELLRESRAIAEELGDDLEVGRSYHNEAAALLAWGRYDQAMDVAARGLDRVRATLAARAMGSGLAAIVAQAALARGRWELADEVLRTAPRDSGGFFAALNQLHHAYLAACRGETGLARTKLAEARRQSVQYEDVLRDRVLTVQLMAALLGADSAQVETVLEIVFSMDGRVDGSSPLVEPAVELRTVVLRTLADRAERGSPERARGDAVLSRCHRLAERAAATLPTLQVWLALAEAEHARLTGAADRAARWATATACCDQLTLAHQGAYTRLRHAQALLDDGSRSEAKQLLAEAHSQAERLGAVPLRNEVLALAWRAGIDLGPERFAAPAQQLGLTPRETEVLELVAAGCTNAEIAKRLYISAKTASVHVSNILRKLEVTNRGEAAALAHRHGLASSRG